MPDPRQVEMFPDEKWSPPAATKEPPTPPGRWETPKKWSLVDSVPDTKEGRASIGADDLPKFRKLEAAGGKRVLVRRQSVLVRMPGRWAPVKYVVAPYKGTSRLAVLSVDPPCSVPLTDISSLLIGAYGSVAELRSWQARALSDAVDLDDHPQNCLEDRLGESSMDPAVAGPR